MKIQIAIVISHLIKEICAGFLCKKHNNLPVCRGHLSAGARFPSPGAKTGTPGVPSEKHFPRTFDGSLAILWKAGIMMAEWGKD